jgi:tRNA pseudouridine38-40 synthase
MPTYRLDIAYDGSQFFGYAIQPNVRTVQGELQQALEPHTGGVPTHVAGRTDKGVHASDQVISFTCDDLDTGRVLRSLNSQLRPQIAARSLVVVDDEFHARFSATGRAYRYRIRNADVHDPLAAATVWTLPGSLDVDVMNEAVEPLVGIHDFAAYCRLHAGRSTVKDVMWARWRRKAELVDFSIGSDSFCHQMVRSVVAMSVEVGQGKVTVAAALDVFRSLDRRQSWGVAPAHGLALVAVAYDLEPLPRPNWVASTS